MTADGCLHAAPGGRVVALRRLPASLASRHATTAPPDALIATEGSCDSFVPDRTAGLLNGASPADRLVDQMSGCSSSTSVCAHTTTAAPFGATARSEQRSRRVPDRRVDQPPAVPVARTSVSADAASSSTHAATARPDASMPTTMLSAAEVDPGRVVGDDGPTGRASSGTDPEVARVPGNHRITAGTDGEVEVDDVGVGDRGGDHGRSRPGASHRVRRRKEQLVTTLIGRRAVRRPDRRDVAGVVHLDVSLEGFVGGGSLEVHDRRPGDGLGGRRDQQPRPEAGEDEGDEGASFGSRVLLLGDGRCGSWTSGFSRQQPESAGPGACAPRSVGGADGDLVGPRPGFRRPILLVSVTFDPPAGRAFVSFAVMTLPSTLAVRVSVITTAAEVFKVSSTLLARGFPVEPTTWIDVRASRSPDSTGFCGDGVGVVVGVVPGGGGVTGVGARPRRGVSPWWRCPGCRSP